LYSSFFRIVKLFAINVIRDSKTIFFSFAAQRFELPDDATSTAPTAMLNEYLKAFDDDGWLISTTDKEGYKDIQSGNVKA
jgi:hypothetical protein